jgi:hypothetical protein
LDGKPREPVRVTRPGLLELSVHARTERHRLKLGPSPQVRIYSIQFAAAPP